MAFDPDERNEVDALWQRTKSHEERISKAEMMVGLVDQRLEALSTELNKTNGKLTETLHRVVDEVRKLGEGMMRIQIRMETKGHLLDRWLPIIISVVAVGVAISQVIK